MNNTTKKGEDKMGIGLGLATLAAVAAGAYFLYGKGGEKRRAQIKGWTLKMKGEVLERVEGLKDVSQETYEKVIDEVKTRYEGLKNVNATELADLADELKAHWNNIKKQIEPKIKRKTATKK